MNWTLPLRRLGSRTQLAGLCGLWLLAFPALALLLLVCTAPAARPVMLKLGLAFVGLLGVLFLGRFGTAWAPYGRGTLVLHATGLFWVAVATPSPGPWQTHLAAALLVLTPLGVWIFQLLASRGSASMRKSRFLVHQIAQRELWPATLDEVRGLPEALTLRDCLQEDPTPAMALLGHPRIEVQVCALSGLQYRRRWRKAHAQILVQTAQLSSNPVIRSLAITALASVEDPLILNAMMELLRDPTPEVRRATAAALLWRTEKRWTIIRQGLRSNLSDPRCARDGALPCLTALPPIALNDLTVWAGEIGSLGQRSSLTLSSYYRRMAREEGTAAFFHHLSDQLSRPGVPAAIRVEIGHLLRDQRMIDLPLAELLIREQQPGPLRIIAADVLLSERQEARAVEVLKEIARQPNRELALAAAVVIQRSLRVDLGLPLGEAPPPAQSKQAAEIVRRVMHWAAQHDQEPKKDEEAIDFDLPHPRNATRV